MLALYIITTALYLSNVDCRRDPHYYGRLIGKLVNYAHGIKGTAYAVDESTIFIKGFSYDGTGPDAFFWVGNTARPSPEGDIVPYPEDYKGREPPVLRAFNDTDIILRLPLANKLKDIRWLSVWCRRFTVNFGEVFIPKELDPPRSRVLPEFKRLAHGLRSGNITILDAKTFYIPNLHYDGGGPDAYFWVGNGSEPSPLGIKVPNEMGSMEVLRGYQGEDIEIQLPGSLTVYEIEWLAVWCVQYQHNFGHVMIPKDLDVPPALGQTKITTSSEKPMTETNCRDLLNGRVQVQWRIEDEWLRVTISAKIREDQYVAFGLSGERFSNSMVGGDVVVVYFDSEKQMFHAIDYYMSATSQCDGKNGVCPDEKLGGRNDVEMLSGERRMGVTKVVYKRPINTNEPINDKPVPMSGETCVIAAIGPLSANKEAFAHASRDKNNEEIRIDFGSKDDHQCEASLYDLPEQETLTPWKPAVIMNEQTFTARIGPSGGQRGYTSITGNPGWGIAWYINDLLIPEIYVERGKTYTFIVEGGFETQRSVKYHPLYITDSREGGYGTKNEEEQRQQRVFAGVSYDSEGYPYPTAAGRYCQWVPNTLIDRSDEFETFPEYFQTLRLACEPGESAYLNWTVPEESPDLLYYQCYTHRYLGWKIHVNNQGYQAASKATHSTSNVFLLLSVCLCAIYLVMR